MHRGIALALFAATAITAGCTRFGGRQPNSSDQPEQAAIPVEVTEATQETMAQAVTVTGTIRAERQTDIGAQISARVLEVRVREGDAVTQGQVLILLDQAAAQSQVRQAEAAKAAAQARLQVAQKRLAIIEEGARPEERAIARNQLEQAQAALRTARADLDRLRGLFDQGAVSKQRLDAAQMAYDTARTNRDSARQSLELVQKGARPEEIDAARTEVEAAAAALQQAEAGLASTREMLTYTVIRSPLSGIVYWRDVDPGEITSTMGGPPLLRIADLSSVCYEAMVPERVALEVQPGQRVDVTVHGNGDRPLQGRVERLVPVASPDSRDFLLRVNILHPGAARPGTFARGLLVVQERPDAVVVPKEALIEREDRTIVFVVKDGKAEARPVIVGLTDRTRAEIIGGVDVWEEVVVAGAGGLQDGAPVRVRRSGGQ